MKNCKHEYNENDLVSTENILNHTTIFTAKCIKCGLPISVELKLDATIPPYVLKGGVIGELNKKVKELNIKCE